MPNPGLSGAVIPGKLERAIFFGDGTNQTAELMAVREAVILANNGDQIFSDSKYAVNIASGKWKANTHHELVAEVRGLLLVKHRVSLHWIRGHNGDEHNERADWLANQAVMLKSSFDVR
jgi:ribonuclease HI